MQLGVTIDGERQPCPPSRAEPEKFESTWQTTCTSDQVEVMRSLKMLRNTMPNVYVNEDLTQVRSALLFKARALKREKRLLYT